MKVLFLGPSRSPALNIMQQPGCDVKTTESPVDVEYVKHVNIDYIVSFGYRHIIRKPVLDYLPNKILNLHISYLPWNRGADPNLWSFLENTPKGVTIHYIDEGIDTGDIIVQAEVEFPDDNETLATSYEKLHVRILDLFASTWPILVSGRSVGRKQEGRGSYHRGRDKEKYLHLLTDGWNTEVRNIIGRGLNVG